MKRWMRYGLGLVVACAAALTAVGGEPAVEVIARTEHGVLGRLPSGKRLLVIAGSPEELGTAQGTLLAPEIQGMYQRMLVVAGGKLYLNGEWFFDRITEVEARTAPYLPEEYRRECDAMSRAAGLREREGREINLFPELFHCSGIAVRGAASADGKVRHARVLDYMRDLGLQDFAVLTVVIPEGKHAWANVSYAGFIGTVTAMNAKGLAIGEMGGGGVGLWDGLPMTFLMRRIMEECATVAEALELMRATPMTCEYYYVLSDATGDMAAVAARGGEPITVIRPEEPHERQPRVFADVVYVSGGSRIDHLADRIAEHYGAIDTPTLIDMIRRPVAMASNLQNAVFEPETLDLYWADAGRFTPACDETYAHINLAEVIDWYQSGAH